MEDRGVVRPADEGVRGAGEDVPVEEADVELAEDGIDGEDGVDDERRCEQEVAVSRSGRDAVRTGGRREASTRRDCRRVLARGLLLCSTRRGEGFVGFLGGGVHPCVDTETLPASIRPARCEKSVSSWA